MKGLEIFAFPCNQFKQLEPKPEAKILKRVIKKYNVKFKMFMKVDVNGPNTHEVYQYLRMYSQLYDEKKGVTGVVPWNFSKFLLDSWGNIIAYYEPKIEPIAIKQDII